MPHKDPEIRRAYRTAYEVARRKQRKIYNAVYGAAHREERKVYLEARRDHVKAISAAYRALHKEERKAYLEAHRMERKIRQDAYDASHREERKAYCITHREEQLAYQAAYYKAHPEIGRLKGQRRRARKKAAPRNDLTRTQWNTVKAHYKHRCYYCKKRPKQLTMDHITPLVKGGSNTLWNVVPACRSCNSRKQAGPPPVPVQPLLL